MRANFNVVMVSYVNAVGPRGMIRAGWTELSAFCGGDGRDDLLPVVCGVSANALNRGASTGIICHLLSI